MKPTIRFNWDKMEWEASPNSKAPLIFGFMNPAVDAAQSVNFQIFSRRDDARLLTFRRWLPYGSTELSGTTANA